MAAAGGVKIIKCGNRSVSSKSGSADVLEALNIPLDLDPERAVRQFEAANFTFLFAPAYNPAIAHVQPVRKSLGVPTLFNTLGPLLSPARPEYQIMGIANPALGQTIAETMRELGRGRAMVVHGAGTDEVAVHGDTEIWELDREGTITHYTVNPADLGLPTYDLAELEGGNGEENATAIRAIFDGTAPDAHRDAVAATAGTIFYLYEVASDIATGVKRAQDLLATGAVRDWLAKHEGADYSA